MSQSDLPLVDIITPTNRAGEFLESTTSSILSQTYGNWRLYIVDDGSPDPSALADAVGGALSAASAPAGVRHRVSIHRGDGRGVSAARNHGLALGSGDYVAFLDDDDLWDPRFLERMVARLERAPHAVAAYSGGRYLDEGGEPFGLWTAPAASSSAMLRGDVPFPRIIALLVRRIAGEATGWFDEQYAYSEDMDLICRLLIAGEFVEVSDPLAFYRIHSASVSRNVVATRRNWMGFEEFFRDRIVEARATGDTTLARDLASNRHRARRNAARMSSHEVLAALAARQNLGEAGATARWALAHAPLTFLASGFERLLARAVRSVGRDRRAHLDRHRSTT